MRGKPSERGCNCGRKRKDDDTRTSCNNSRCPCFTAKVSCSRICRCKGCGNPRCNSVPVVDSAINVECSCRNSPVSCKDTTSTRKSKCPCLRNGKKCLTCKCKNCGNGKDDSANVEPQCHKRKRNNEPMFKRTKGCDYLAQHGFDINCSSWTELETIVLIAILDILQESPLEPNVLNSSFLYRHLFSSSILQNSGLKITQKRNSQIAGKLLHMRKNVDIHVQMLEKESESTEG